MKVKFRDAHMTCYIVVASTPRDLIKWSYDGLKSMTAKIIIKYIYIYIYINIVRKYDSLDI